MRSLIRKPSNRHRAPSWHERQSPASCHFQHSAFPFYSLQKPHSFAPDFFTALSRMTFAVLPASIPLPCSLAELARETGPSWIKVRNACEGRGTLASLDRVRHAAGWRWSWTAQTGPLRAGRDLASRRRARGLSQRDMAARLGVSPQTVLVLDRPPPSNNTDRSGHKRPSWLSVVVNEVDENGGAKLVQGGGGIVSLRAE